MGITTFSIPIINLKSLGKLSFLPLLGLLLALASCGSQVPPPQPIDERSDLCLVCHMYIHDNGYAAEVFSDSGRVWKLDDIGEVGELLHLVPGLKVRVIYVQDCQTKAWIQAPQAFWVRDDSLPTPMDFGFHALASAPAQEKFLAAHPQGKKITWAEVLAAPGKP